MPLTKEQQEAVQRITSKNNGVIAAEDITREQAQELLSVDRLQNDVQGPMSFFDRAKTAIKDRAGDIKETFQKTASGEITPVETGFRFVGDVIGGAGDIFGAAIEPAVRPILESKLARPAVEKLAQGMEAYEKWKSESDANERIGEMIESIVNIGDLFGATAATKKTSQVALKGGKRIFDKTKSVTERAAQLRATVKKTEDVAEEVVKDVTERAPISTRIKESFTENPNITGAIEDIKIMVGLPENTPSTDMTFRAVKPRITKDKNLKRVKSQMSLANETIVENGFRPQSVREYADAIYDTKQKVWAEINNKLTSDIAQKTRVDLTPVAIRLVDMAEDTALLRTNPAASKQIMNIAENLVQYGDDVDILEAERIKQLINAELDNSFGTFDLSQQAKNAKKEVTAYIGEKLNESLSEIPDEFKNLKIKYGALSAIEDDVLKRAIVFERRNPEGLADMLTKTEAAAEMAFGGTQGRIKALARLTMQSRLKKANDADELIKRAFQKMKKGIPQAGQ